MRGTECRDLPTALQLPKAGISLPLVCHLHGSLKAVRQACACTPLAEPLGSRADHQHVHKLNLCLPSWGVVHGK